MIFNTFIGLRLKKLIIQLTIFFFAIIAFLLLIQSKNDKKDIKIDNSEVIYEKNEFDPQKMDTKIQNFTLKKWS